jgi:hypothetical protein
VNIASAFSTWWLGLYTATIENESTLVILIDGKIVFQKPIGGSEDQALVDHKGPAGRDEIMSRFAKIPVKVNAGVRDITVAFIDRSHVESDENVAAGFTGIGALGFGAGNTASRVSETASKSPAPLTLLVFHRPQVAR